MQVALTKAASTLAQVALLVVAISGGSDGLLTTASHQGAVYRCDSSVIHQHFLDERWFDLHFLDNDFHFLDNRCGWPADHRGARLAQYLPSALSWPPRSGAAGERERGGRMRPEWGTYPEACLYCRELWARGSSLSRVAPRAGLVASPRRQSRSVQSLTGSQRRARMKLRTAK